jgi:hypothetical protein
VKLIPLTKSQSPQTDARPNRNWPAEASHPPDSGAVVCTGNGAHTETRLVFQPCSTGPRTWLRSGGKRNMHDQRDFEEYVSTRDFQQVARERLNGVSTTRETFGK